MSHYALKEEDDKPNPQAHVPDHAPTNSSHDASKPAAPPASVNRRKRRASSAARGAPSLGSSRGVANLTAEQLAKKRANDREAQRAIRERTKTQIETLERRIEDLTSQDPYRDLQEAIRAKELVEAENEDIKRRLAQVLAIIQPLLGNRAFEAHAAPTPAPAARPSPQVDAIAYNGQLQHASSSSYTEAPSAPSGSSTNSIPSTPYGTTWHHTSPAAQVQASRTAPTGPSGTQAEPAYPHPPERLDQRNAPPPSESSRCAPHMPPAPRSAPTTEPRRPGSHLPTDSHIILGTTLAPSLYQSYQVLHAPPLSIPPTRLNNIHPICPLDTVLLNFLTEQQQRAAQYNFSDTELLGPPYPDVTALVRPERARCSPPLSRLFIDILKTFPDLAELPLQIGVLYSMSFLMRWQICPSPENHARIPDHLKPLDSQLQIPHPAWVDHVPWPRMRDEMVRNYERYPFDEFFVPYTTTLAVYWPYDAGPPLVEKVPGVSDELVMSPELERRIRDIGAWSLGPAFEKAHPGLALLGPIKG